MKSKRHIQYALLCAIVLGASCGIRIKGGKKGNISGTEVFLVDNGVLQYFVKPLKFSSGTDDLMADFTFRGEKDSLYKAKINFTVAGNSHVAKIDSYKLVDVSNRVILNCKDMTASTVKNGKRYFSTANNNVLFRLFNKGEAFRFVAYTHDSGVVYSPGSKAVKQIKRVPAELVE